MFRLDPRFGTHGRRTIGFGRLSEARATDLAFDEMGRAVVAGTYFRQGEYGIALARFLPGA